MEGGNNLEQATALVAAANRVVQDPSSVGSALRTISLRLRGTSVEILEEMGEETDGVVESTSKLQEKLKALTGVDILTDTGVYKDTYTILKEIGEAWKNIDPMDQAAALELMAGKNRANTLAAILNNMKDLEGAYESALNANGSALQENAAYLDSIQGKIDQFNNAVQTMWMNFLNDDAIKFIVEMATGLIKLIDYFGVLNTAVAAFFAYMSYKKNINIFANMLPMTKQLGTGIVSLVKNIYLYVASLFTAKTATSLAEVGTRQLTQAQNEQAASATFSTKVSKFLSAAFTTTGAAATGASVGVKLLTSALTFGLSIALGFALPKIIEWLDDLHESAEETADKVKELTDAYKTAKKEFSEKLDTLTISGDKGKYDTLLDEFEALTSGVDKYGRNVSLASDEYERYLQICDLIVDFNPSIVDGYQNAAEAIGDNASALKELIDLKKEEARLSAAEYVSMGRYSKNGNFETLVKGAQSEYQTAAQELYKYNNVTDVYSMLTDAFGWNDVDLFTDEDLDLAQLIMEIIGLDVQNLDQYRDYYGRFSITNTWVKDYADDIAAAKQQFLDYIEKERLTDSPIGNPQSFAEAVLGYSEEDFNGRWPGKGIPDIIEDFINDDGGFNYNAFANQYGGYIGAYKDAYLDNLESELTEWIDGFNGATEDMKSARDGMIDELLEIPNATVGYYDLNAETRSFITEWIKNNPAFKLDGEVTEETAIEQFEDAKKIISNALKNVLGNESLSEIFNELGTLDKSSGTFAAYREHVNTLFDSIYNELNKDGRAEEIWGLTDDNYKQTLAVEYGLEWMFDGSDETLDVDDFIEEAKSFTGEQEEDIINYLNRLPPIEAERMIRYNYTALEGHDDPDTPEFDGTGTLDKMYDVSNPKIVRPLAIKTYTDLNESANTLNEALATSEELYANGAQTSQEYYDSLIKLGIEKAALSECIDESNGYIVTNADELRNLIKAQKEELATEAKLAKSHEQLKYYELVRGIDALIGTKMTLAGQTEEEKEAFLAEADAMFAQAHAIKNSIKQYQLLEDTLLGTVNAFDQFAKAKELDEQNTYGTSYVEMAQTMYDAIRKTGQVGSEQFWAAVRANVPDDIYAGLTPGKDQINAISKYLNENVFSTLTLNEDSFSIDYSSIENFVEKAQKRGLFTGTDASSFGLSADFINGLATEEDALKAFADEMDMTVSQVYAMLAEMDKYNADGIGLAMLLRLDKSTAGQITLVTNELDRLLMQRKALIEQGADEVTLNANADAIYAAESQMNVLQQQAMDAVTSYAMVDRAIEDTSKKVSEVLPEAVYTKIGLNGDDIVQNQLAKLQDYLLNLGEPTVVELEITKQEIEDLENLDPTIEAHIQLNEDGLYELVNESDYAGEVDLQHYVELKNAEAFIDSSLEKGLTTTETLLSKIADNTAIMAGTKKSDDAKHPKAGGGTTDGNNGAGRYNSDKAGGGITNGGGAGRDDVIGNDAGASTRKAGGGTTDGKNGAGRYSDNAGGGTASKNGAGRYSDNAGDDSIVEPIIDAITTGFQGEPKSQPMPIQAPDLTKSQSTSTEIPDWAIRGDRKYLDTQAPDWEKPKSTPTPTPTPTPTQAPNLQDVKEVELDKPNLVSIEEVVLDKSNLQDIKDLKSDKSNLQDIKDLKSDGPNFASIEDMQPYYADGYMYIDFMGQTYRYKANSLENKEGSQGEPTLDPALVPGTPEFEAIKNKLGENNYPYYSETGGGGAGQYGQAYDPYNPTTEPVEINVEWIIGNPDAIKDYFEGNMHGARIEFSEDNSSESADNNSNSNDGNVGQATEQVKGLNDATQDTTNSTKDLFEAYDVIIKALNDLSPETMIGANEFNDISSALGIDHVVTDALSAADAMALLQQEKAKLAIPGTSGALFDVTAVKEGVLTYSELQSKAASFNEILDQTDEIIGDNTEVTQAYKESLKGLCENQDELDELNACFDTNNTLVVKNSKALKKLVKEKKKELASDVKLSKAQSQLEYYDLVRQLNGTLVGVKTLDDATTAHVSSILSQIDVVQQSIYKFQLLEDQLLGTTSAFEKYKEAQEIDGLNTYGDDYVSMAQTMYDAFYKTGEVGTQANWEAIQALIPPEVYQHLKDEGDQLKAIYDYFNKYVLPTLTLKDDQFSLDYDATENFVEKGIDKGVFVKDTTEDGKTNLDLVEGMNLEKAAELMNMTETQAYAMFAALDKFNFNGNGQSFLEMLDDSLSGDIMKITSNIEELNREKLALLDGGVTEEERRRILVINAALSQSQQELQTLGAEAYDAWQEFTQVDSALAALGQVEDKSQKVSEVFPDELITSLGLTGDETVQQAYDLLLQKQLELEEPTVLTAQLAIENIDSQITELETALNNNDFSNIDPVSVGLEVGQAPTKADVEAKLAALKEDKVAIATTFHIELSEEEKASLQQELNAIETFKINDKEFTVTGNTSATMLKLIAVRGALGLIKDKEIEVKTKYTYTGTPPTGSVDVNGTAHAQGTAFKSGSWGAPKTETALVGELGPEMVVRGNKWTLVGENGAEFTGIRKGDIIFNHKQTEDLLSHGYVAGRGKAYAEGTIGGTAYALWKPTSPNESLSNTAGSEINNASSKLSKAANDISKSSDKFSDDFKEIFDWIEVRIEEITERLDLKSAKLENAVGSKKQNAIIDDMIELNQKFYDNLTAGAAKYYEYAAKLLEKVPAEYRTAAQDGSIAIESFVGKVGDKTLTAIQDYREWVQKGANATQQAEETLTEISSLAKQAIDNIAADYENKRSLRDNKIDQFEAYNSLLETDIGYESAKIYQAMIDENAEIIGILESQRNDMLLRLNQSVESGEIKRGSQDWYDAVNDIAAVDTEIIELKTDVEDYQDAINELHWEHFDNFISQLEAVSDEAENLIDILGNEDVVDEVGNWTKEGIASLGLYVQQMENAEMQAKQYQEEISYLNKDWKKLGYTEQEYIEKLEELKSGQYDAIKAYHDTKDAIVDLNSERVDAIKNGIEREIESYEKLISAKKEELDAEKD